VQATAAGVAVALGGIMKDVIGALAEQGWFGPGLARASTGYVAVYGAEIALLAVTVLLMSALRRAVAR